MSPEASTKTVAKQIPATVSLSRWVNERPLPITEILSAHDVARLTRRPVWVLTGLALIGRFPKKLKHRGRRIGWCRSDVLDWMSRDLAVAPVKQERVNSHRHCSRRQTPQACLPLDCATPCPSLQKCSRAREPKAARRPEGQP